LECCRIINEPTAAALAYGLEKKSMTKDEDINVLVYDFGGGTLDTSLLNISDGMFQVLASTGNTHLGGADFDNRLVSYCKNFFKKKYKINKLTNLPLTSLQKLRNSCENAKKVLSITWKANIAVKDFYDGKNLFITLTRDKFNIICRDLLILCLKPVEDVLISCDMEKDEIDEIILVGGATRIPAIRDNLKLFFQGKEPNSTINPDEVVSAGAAIQAYMIANKTDPFSENVVLLDVIPLSLGVETIGNIMNVLIPRNSVIPIKRKRKYTTDSDYETSVRVKIFEGERKMTKDNFMVGEFLLEGLEAALRGIAEIEITFCIDVNGIISVTAEDLKNDQNKNSITITGNKGRLTPEEIKKLVKEAREQETKDKLEREKMQLFYEIEDLCSNIGVNIKSDDFKLKPRDIELITADIEKVTSWLEEKQYSERNKKELEKVLVRIKKKYGTLMLKATHDNDNVKADEGEKVEATTVYGDEEDEENVYEEIENEEFGFTDDMAQEEKNELKQLRETMVELCYNIFEIISGTNTKMSKEDKVELRDHIDDILLWVHVKDKIKKVDYIQKIDEINKACDDMMQKYEDCDVFEKNSVVGGINSKKDELEQICYAIMSSIHNNMFSLHDKEIKLLDKNINSTLEWLLQCEIDSKKAELEGKQLEVPDDEYQKRLDQINDMCNNLYNNMLSINIESFTEDIVDGDINSSKVFTGAGTSIQSLLAQTQSQSGSQSDNEE
jgi:molecular chaperone DnaK (HSP70)